MPIGAEALWWLVPFVVLPAIATNDIRQQRIPNQLTLLLALGGIGQLLAVETHLLISALLTAVVTWGAGALFGMLYARIRGRAGLGMGDVKLFAAVALWVGPRGISWVVLIASFSALVLIFVLWFAGRPVGRSTRLPFAPHIAIGMGIVLLLQWRP